MALSLGDPRNELLNPLYPGKCRLLDSWIRCALFSYGVGTISPKFRVVFFSVALFFVLIVPLLLEVYYPQVAFSWITDSIFCGFAALAFVNTLFLLPSALVHDVRQWLYGVAQPGSTSVPAALALQRLRSEPTKLSPELVSISFSAFVVSGLWAKDDVVSLKRPLVENVRAALFYTLRGLEVLFVGLLVLMVLVFLAWLKNGSQSGAGALAQTIEMSLDEVHGVSEKEKEYINTETKDETV
ncbi:hypothetical protein B0H13DRAFT_2673946 [Mycena leptocephala]|nr:hypothetical protein B0H13DRAFT_2673946 [Mycena leptocephala]